MLHQTDHNKPAWDELPWAVRTGGKAFEKTHNGLSEFEWLKLDPKEEDKFSKAMKQVDSMGAALTTLGRDFLEIDQIRAQAQQDFLRSCHTLVPECDEYHLMAGRLDRVKFEWRPSFGLSSISFWLTMKCVQGRLRWRQIMTGTATLALLTSEAHMVPSSRTCSPPTVSREDSCSTSPRCCTTDSLAAQLALERHRCAHVLVVRIND